MGAILAFLPLGCGDGAHAASWRNTPVAHGMAGKTQISETEYPPFSPGIFPCSRCHGEAAPQPDAPQFAHALHLSEGLACTDCHGEGEPAAAKVDFCLECHDNPAEGSDGVRAYFAGISDGAGGYKIPSRWKDDELVPHHAAHAAAKVECAVCHGEPGRGPVLKPGAAVLMERCIACHQERNAPVKCETCHTKVRERQHKDIVLHHAEKQRDCFGCHNPGNRDVLRLANGTTLPFEESYLLCGQCHGPKLRDWRDGLHGKRTGKWTGPQKYELCVHCHNPHSPRFAPMHALQRPPKPEEIR